MPEKTDGNEFSSNDALVRYTTLIQSLPELVGPTLRDQGNDRYILNELFFILEDVVALAESRRLQFTEEEGRAFIDLANERIYEIPQTNANNKDVTRVTENIRKIQAYLREWHNEVPEDSLFGENASLIAEQKLLEITESLENRDHNPGHAASIKRGAPENEMAIHEMANKITTIRSLVTHNTLVASPEQADRFENALRSWLGSVEIDEATKKNNQLDDESLESLMLNMRQRGRRQ